MLIEKHRYNSLWNRVKELIRKYFDLELSHRDKHIIT